MATPTPTSTNDGPQAIHFELGVMGQRVPLSVVVSGGPTRPRRLLPVLHQISAVLVDVAVAREAQAGREVSCRKGCGACCRQLVPITEPETHRLREVVAALPEPQRQRVLARFADAKAQLAAQGVLTDLDQRTDLDQEAFKALALRYRSAQVACPFLEEESCSIHRDRPLVCREFLVTSPAERCAEDPPSRVTRVALPGRASAALARLQQRQSGAAVAQGEGTPWVPLVLALDHAQAQRDRAAPHPGPELLKLLISELAAT